jgi:hydroxyacylglutathione hydrolase
MIQVVGLPAFQDNYLWLIYPPSETGGASLDAVAVDPGDAQVVLRGLAGASGGLPRMRLTHVLCTHHHGDHVGGNAVLKTITKARVVGPAKEAKRIPAIDQGVASGDLVDVGFAKARVIAVAGHTLGHVAYWFEADRIAFCGDALFSLGCGRLFEGTAEQLHASLQALAALPPETRLYCAHEYTESNARFALSVDPDNLALRRRVKEVQDLRAAGQPTVPTTVGAELASNPFLRPHAPEIRARLGGRYADAATPDWEVVGELRRRKDAF